ncbi:MAG: hypothetical protein WC449_05520 [Candidatus Paceibacterota bacterium]
MVIKLNIFGRILLGNILPQKGSITQLLAARDIKKLVELTREEIAAIKLRDGATPGSIEWDGTVPEAQPKDFTFKDSEIKLIKDTITDLSNKGLLQQEHLFLYDLFMA